MPLPTLQRRERDALAYLLTELMEVSPSPKRLENAWKSFEGLAAKGAVELDTLPDGIQFRFRGGVTVTLPRGVDFVKTVNNRLDRKHKRLVHQIKRMYEPVRAAQAEANASSGKPLAEVIPLRRERRV